MLIRALLKLRYLTKQDSVVLHSVLDTMTFILTLGLTLWSDPIVTTILITFVTIVTANDLLTCFLHKRRRRLQKQLLRRLKEPVFTNSGETLYEVANNICYSPTEIVAFFSKDGKKVYESTNYHPNCAFVDIEHLWHASRQQNMIMLHNHPGDEPVAFSPEDLNLLCMPYVTTSIVVTSSACFKIERPEGSCKVNLKRIARLYDQCCKNAGSSLGSVHFCFDIAKRFHWKFEILPPIGQEAKLLHEIGLPCDDWLKTFK